VRVVRSFPSGGRHAPPLVRRRCHDAAAAAAHPSAPPSTTTATADAAAGASAVASEGGGARPAASLCQCQCASGLGCIGRSHWGWSGGRPGGRPSQHGRCHGRVGRLRPRRHDNAVVCVSRRGCCRSLTSLHTTTCGTRGLWQPNSPVARGRWAGVTTASQEDGVDGWSWHLHVEGRVSRCWTARARRPWKTNGSWHAASWSPPSVQGSPRVDVCPRRRAPQHIFFYTGWMGARRCPGQTGLVSAACMRARGSRKRSGAYPCAVPSAARSVAHPCGQCKPTAYNGGQRP